MGRPEFPEPTQGTGELLFEIFVRLAHSFFQRTYPTADVDNQVFHEAVRTRWDSYISTLYQNAADCTTYTQLLNALGQYAAENGDAEDDSV
jgi:hypothetical protein